MSAVPAPVVTRRSPPAAWEAAFLIGVFPPGSPLRWAKVQLFSGGPPGRHCLSAVEGLDGPAAQLVVEADGAAVRTSAVELDREALRFDEGGWSVRAPGVDWTGDWPSLELTVGTPAVEASTETREVLWWLRRPRLLSYWTGFGPLRWNGVEGVGLVERAWGAATRFDPARLGTLPWHWDVLAFPDGSACAGLAVGAGGRLRGLRSGGTVPGEAFGRGRGVAVRVTRWSHDEGRRGPAGGRGRVGGGGGPRA